MQGGQGARGALSSQSWLCPGLTFFMLPRVTVERALDISRGLRPRNSPIFPSTCTMYLAAGEQTGQRHARPRCTHSWVTFTPRPDTALSLSTCRIPSREGAPAITPGALGPHSQTSSLAHFLLQNLQNIYIF